MLFVVGGIYDLSDVAKMSKANSNALVTTSYFAGGLCFTLGAYAGILEVINVPNKEDGKVHDWCFCGRAQWRKMRHFLGWEPLVSSSVGRE